MEHRRGRAVVGGGGYKVFTELLLRLQEQQDTEPALQDFTTVLFMSLMHSFSKY